MLEVRRWALWRLPRAAVAYLLLVQGAAATLAVIAGKPSPALADLAVLTGLLLGALGTALAVRRNGEDESHADVVDDSNDVWLMAAVLLLPSALLVPFAYAFQAVVDLLADRLAPARRRRTRRGHLHQRLFNAAKTTTAAATAQLVVVHATGDAALSSARGAAAAGLALLVCALVHDALLLGVVVLATSQGLPETVRSLRPGAAQQLIGLSCGVLYAYAWTATPLAALFAVPLVNALQRASLYDLLQRRAETDVKTGLANADAWRRAASACASSAGPGRPCSVLLLDLDHFKRVNDVHGHLAGDEVLRQVAERLLCAVRPEDVVGRWGGEELTVLLPGADAYVAAVVAERCLESVRREPVQLTSGSDVCLTVSIGTATTVRSCGTDELLRCADEALYRAKQSGRDRVTAGVPG